MAFINLLEGPYIYGEHISKGSKVSYRDLGGFKVWAGVSLGRNYEYVGIRYLTFKEEKFNHHAYDS